MSHCWASLVAQLVKNPPAMWKTWVLSMAWEDPLDKGKATHSRILAWRSPWTVQFMGSQRVGHDWETFAFTFSHCFKKKKKCSFRELFCKSQGLVTICSKKQNTTFSNMDFLICLMRLISPLVPKSFYYEKEEFEILSLKSTYSLVYKNKTGANTQNNLR